MNSHSDVRVQIPLCNASIFAPRRCVSGSLSSAVGLPSPALPSPGAGAAVFGAMGASGPLKFLKQPLRGFLAVLGGPSFSLSCLSPGHSKADELQLWMQVLPQTELCQAIGELNVLHPDQSGVTRSPGQATSHRSRRPSGAGAETSA